MRSTANPITAPMDESIHLFEETIEQIRLILQTNARPAHQMKIAITRQYSDVLLLSTEYAIESRTESSQQSWLDDARLLGDQIVSLDASVAGVVESPLLALPTL